MDDEELKKQIADRREEYERAAQEAEGPPDPKDESGQGT
jgi:hypothetical protein